MTNWMTAAGIALIAGAIATLFGFRQVLWGSGRRRSGSRTRSAAAAGARSASAAARPSRGRGRGRDRSGRSAARGGGDDARPANRPGATRRSDPDEDLGDPDEQTVRVPTVAAGPGPADELGSPLPWGRRTAARDEPGSRRAGTDTRRPALGDEPASRVADGPGGAAAEEDTVVTGLPAEPAAADREAAAGAENVPVQVVRDDEGPAGLVAVPDETDAPSGGRRRAAFGTRGRRRSAAHPAGRRARAGHTGDEVGTSLVELGPATDDDPGEIRHLSVVAESATTAPDTEPGVAEDAEASGPAHPADRPARAPRSARRPADGVPAETEPEVADPTDAAEESRDTQGPPGEWPRIPGRTPRQANGRPGKAPADDPEHLADLIELASRTLRPATKTATPETPAARRPGVDPARADRVSDWVRPEYREEPESITGEYWLPVPGAVLPDDDAEGYGWPVPLERLPMAPPVTPEEPDPAEDPGPTRAVPKWPPLRSAAPEPKEPAPASRIDPARISQAVLNHAAHPKGTWEVRDRDAAGVRNLMLDSTYVMPRPELDPGGRTRPRPRPRPSGAENRSTVYVSKHAAEPG